MISSYLQLDKAKHGDMIKALDDDCCNNTLKECRIRQRFGGEQGMTGNYA